MSENNVNISVKDLVLEVTRRCNMCCEHCLRGDSENMDITKDVIDRTLDLVEDISTITFTGGEPSLNVEAIKYFFRRAKELNKMPASFYVVTNGLANQEELAVTLLTAYPEMSEKELCGVSLSIDNFHDSLPISENDHLLTGLSFYRKDKELDYSDYYLINEGKAMVLKRDDYPAKGFKDPCLYPLPEIEDIYENCIYLDTMYVAANGNIFGNCDCSYNHVDMMSKYNVADPENFIKAIKG